VRGTFSDQDLTDYALNELEPADRIYIESMLAVSEECRNDVYRTIDLAQTIEQGFEREGWIAEELSLLPEQRANLTRPHFTGRYLLREAASAIGLAACVAFVVTILGKLERADASSAASRMAQVSSEVSTKVSSTVSQAVQSPESVDMKSAFEALRAMVADPSNWLPISEGMPKPPELCTPPTFILESAQLSSGDLAP
jgi:anti-sigma factor RsiW